MMSRSATHEGLLQLEGLLLDDRFEIVRRLTCGSYAEIYLVRNLTPQKGEPETLVVKALNLWLQGEEDAELERTLIENIKLEAQTMKRCRHQHIARLYADGRALDRCGRQFYYLILEHLSGGSLAQLCCARPLSFERALEYTSQICAALSHAHALDVLHRDVKPSNIMLTADLRKVKMLDFGVARLLSNDSGTVTKVGTALYAAPEHFSLSHLSQAKLTPAADVYALAKTVYFMLCGQPPYSFRQQQISALPVPIQEQAWAAGVLSALYKATAEEPSDRYHSAAEFYLALQAMTEQTVNSARARQTVAAPQRRPDVRVVIDIAPERSRAPCAKLRAVGALSFEVVRRCCSHLARLAKTFYGRVLTLLIDWRIRFLDLWQQCMEYLERLPFQLLLRIAVISILCFIILIATPRLIAWGRSQFSLSPARPSLTEASTDEVVISGTDINIHAGPNKKALLMGLVEHGSKVRILRFSGDHRWCEIEILQHGRSKKEISAADHGWVYFKALS